MTPHLIATASRRCTWPGADRFPWNFTAPYVHLYVARGSVDVEGVGVLDYADALRSTVEFGRRVTAVADAEIIVWEMHTTVAA